MFEIFLFINPIGFYCYDTENRVQKTLDELDLDASIHFVPIANVNVVQDDMIRRRCNAQKLCDLSFYTLTTNQALRIYHAIKIAYGNRKARQFLYDIQAKLNDGTDSCSNCLVKEMLAKQNLNEERILALQKSVYVQDSITEDQTLADQWHIKKAPTTIIFNENENADSGVLLEGKIDQDELLKVFKPEHYTKTQNSFQNMFATNHLRLI